MQRDTIDEFPPRWERAQEIVAEDTLTVETPQDEAWRLEQFENLGIDPTLSKWLAFQKADWQKARAMIENGCHPDVAADILL